MDQLADVWASRDFPVLRAVARRIDSGETTPKVHDVAEDTGLTEEEVSLAAKALKRRGLVDNIGTWGAPVLRFKELSGEAYLLTGLHPNGDDAISRLVDALGQAVDRVDDPEEKSRLRRVRDAVGGVSRDVMAAVLAAAITGGISG